MHFGVRAARLQAMLRVSLLAALVLCLAPAVARADDTRIYFTKGEQLAYVTRDLPAGIEPAIRELLNGPPAGYGTTLPAGETVTVKDTSIDFTPDLKYEALAQVVYTATATGEDEVKVDGETYTRADFGPEPFTTPKPPTRKTAAPADPKAVQTKLAGLGYLPDDAVTGKWDYRTMQAVIAFQAWSGLTRDGVVGPMTQAKLKGAGRPLPLDRTSKGKRVEIYRARGVVLLISSGRVVRAIHTSTGIGGDDPDLGTPPGTWKIYRKELRSWSVPYKTWLPFAAYWNAGWALHGYASVPAQPASHGCARLPLPEAKIVYAFARIGTPVRVI
jgi:L,D-transpeptidase catalytic domain/Putative peptidoglycan binding domain